MCCHASALVSARLDHGSTSTDDLSSGRFTVAATRTRQSTSAPPLASRDARPGSPQLRDRIALLESEIAEHDARIADVDRRRDALDAELRALPSVDAVRSAIDAVRVSTALEAEAERGYERAAAAARSAADAELAASAAQREHAVDHRLSPALDEPALDTLRDATAQLTGAGGAVAHAWTIAEREAQAADAVAARLSRAQQTPRPHVRSGLGTRRSRPAVWRPSTPHARKHSARPESSFAAATNRW